MAGRFKDSPAVTDLKNIPIPSNIQCRECQKVKPASQFSNKQLNDLRFKIASGFSLNANAATLRCRLCTGNQNHELLCNGPCGSIRSLDSFSKNQRRIPEKAWCMNCIRWKEAMEPGLITLPPPNNELSPDEERILQETEALGRGDHDFDEDLDTDGDDDHLYESMTTLSTDGQAPSVRHDGLRSGFRERASESNNTRSSPSNPFNQTANNSSSVMMGRNKAELNQVKAGPESKRPSVYNAWNSNSQKQARFRTPQSSDLDPSGTKRSSERPPVRRGGWIKVTGQRRSAPEYTVTRPTGNTIGAAYVPDSDDEDDQELI